MPRQYAMNRHPRVHTAKNVRQGFGTLVMLPDEGQVVSGIPVSRTGEEHAIPSPTVHTASGPRTAR
jgi:hypothetical protein